MDNVCQLLVLSDMYRAHKLREYSLIVSFSIISKIIVVVFLVVWRYTIAST